MSCAFNAHVWEEVARVYIAPQGNLRDLKLQGDEDALSLIRQLTMGVTSIELKCKRCHTIMEKQLLGDHT